MTDVIVVKDLVKQYKKTKERAVDGISFSVAKGSFFTFLGPNGAGKTTTISILTTILAKTSGEVNIAGFDIDRGAGQIRSHIGIIFQNPSLDLNLTAEENIRFHACLYGLYSFRPTYSLMDDGYKSRVQELADIIGIKKEIFSPVKTFSGGMKRKLEIVRSLIHSPQILFLDEPTTGLDPLSRSSLWRYLKQVRSSQNTTIFLTTHYLEEAEESDMVCILKQGKIAAQGTPAQIKSQLIKEYVLLDSPEPKALASELDHMNLKYERSGAFKLFIPSTQLPQLIKSISAPISNIKTHSPTLEEAYLEVIDGQTT